MLTECCAEGNAAVETWSGGLIRYIHFLFSLPHALVLYGSLNVCTISECTALLVALHASLNMRVNASNMMFISQDNRIFEKSGRENR